MWVSLESFTFEDELGDDVISICGVWLSLRNAMGDL